MTRRVDINHQTFVDQNKNVATNMQSINQQLDNDRKQREREAREAEIARDKAELQWTNDTQLKFSSTRSYADKFLKK